MSETEEKDSWVPEAQDPCTRCGRDMEEIGVGAAIETGFYKERICQDCLKDLLKFLDMDRRPL